MRIAGIIVGIFGAILFIWHMVKVVMGTDVDTGYMNHATLSMIGGLLVIVGTGLYLQGRRATPPNA